jgi:hypothetical protein
MLNEFSRYENLGTPKFFYELFCKLASNEQSWTTLNIKEYFYNRIIEKVSIFDGCVPFAQAVGAIIINQDGIVTLNPSFVQTLVNEKYLSNKLLEMILMSLKGDNAFHEIFCSENISYDIIYKHIQIENTAFQLRHANFRNLLVSFTFLQQHPDSNIRKLIVNQKFKRLFDRDLIPEIKRRKIGIDQLEKLLAQKQIYGSEAEEFVLQFERRRLAFHKKLQNVEIISEYDVQAGFDIVSYENTDSHDIDRFIEVKSFSGVPNFHWSRNEINVSRIKKAQYFLYLVDRGQMNNKDYIPHIIQNPHEQVLERPAEWEKRVEEYFISQSGAKAAFSQQKTL